MGAIGLFSFNGNKIMTTSGGGALLSPDLDTADRVRYLATQARQPTVHYEHTDVGFNYRLSNLLAAIGRAQLARIPEMSARRLAINEFYRRRLADLPGLAFMPIAPWGGWNGWLTCVTFDDPAAARRGAGRRWRRPRSRAARCGSRCTSSRCSPTRRRGSTAPASTCSSTGCACRAAAC